MIRDEEGRVGTIVGRSGRHAGPRAHTRGVRDPSRAPLFLPCQIGTKRRASGSRPDRRVYAPYRVHFAGSVEQHPDAMRRRLAPRGVAITRVNPIVNREARGRLVVTRGRGRGSQHDLGGD